MKNTFLDKLLNRIDRVGQGDLQAYLQRLNNEKGFFETIFNTLQEGIVVVDSQGRILYLNHAVTTLLGIDPAKAMGAPISQHLRELDWSTILAEGRVVNRDLEVFYPQQRYLNFYLVPLEDKDTSLLGFAIIFHDLTARRAQAREAIESEKLNAVTLLAAGVAHELGNPLNSLNIHLQLLERDLHRREPGASDEELLDSVRIARSEVGRLDTIISQFLGAVRPAHTVRTMMSINAVVRESLAFLQPEIKDRDVIVQEELAEALPLIPANADQLKQAFYNLIKNAVQALPHGGILRVATSRSDTHLQVSFEDNGTGISVEDMAHITEPYFTRKKNGTGLGLFIVQRILHEHGGLLELLSEPGRGTTARILLPLAERRVRLLGPGDEPSTPSRAQDTKATMSSPVSDNLPTLLVVEDEKNTREGLRRYFNGKFDIYLASDVTTAMNMLETQPVDVLLTDLRLMGGTEGLDLLGRLKTLSHPPVPILMTAYGSEKIAVQAMKRGAYDYITKPLDLEKLEAMLVRALHSRRIETENRQLREELDKKFGLEKLIGNAPAMVEIYERIRQVAPTRATVLIEGESGTGKELVAQSLHMLSPRKAARFVAVHCAALSPQLLESELFGHEKGSFTGASERRVGRFEEANHGTIFLDEIGEIDAATQVKLLRALGEQTIQRVGSNQTIKVDVRVVAATNKHLETLVREGKFRDDLFYRLDVVPIHLPPLRERREDIPLLIQAFCQEFARQNNKRIAGLSPEARDALQRYDWPGNIRELRAAIEHAVALCRGERIGVRDLPTRVLGQAHPFSVAGSGADPDSVANLNLEAMEKKFILQALRLTEWNVTEAAKLLGISRRTLHRKIKTYKIEPR